MVAAIAKALRGGLLLQDAVKPNRLFDRACFRFVPVSAHGSDQLIPFPMIFREGLQQAPAPVVGTKGVCRRGIRILLALELGSVVRVGDVYMSFVSSPGPAESEIYLVKLVRVPLPATASRS